MRKFREWLRNNTDLMERTILNYDRTIDRFHSHFFDPTVENINRFISQSTKESTSYYVKYAFKHYLEYIGKPEIYKMLVKIKQKPRKKKGCYISEDNIKRIINNITNPVHRAVAIVQYLTGARAGDVLRFSSENIITDGESVRMRLITKGGKEHIVFIPKKYSVRITQFIETRNKKYPFLEGTSDDFRKWVDTNYRYYYNSLKAAASSAGFPKFTSHDFRRNFLEDVFDNTKDIRAAQNLAGHSSLQYTLKYVKAHAADERLKEIVEELRG